MRLIKRIPIKQVLLVSIAASLLIASAIFVWVATLEIPTLDGFEERTITQSTKIYDRTGDVLLFDLHQDIRRTVVPLEDMSRHLKNATIAIEDAEFYEHNGIRPMRTLKAVYDNVVTGDLLGGQGGSTITQQVVKNTLLTTDKTITRKVKEWILALKIEQILAKDDILELYLNEVPYGGNIYGAEEAAKHFFATSAEELTLVESAYLAALPQAPTRYSPYGNHTDLLEERKNRVLQQMLENGFISPAEYEEAVAAEVVFEQYGDTNIKAPHFVFYIREQLEETYGREALYETGLKVITTLNYDLQQAAEEVVTEYAYQNEEDFNAENAALVAIDPQTGHILAMVGSRNYFDEDIDGKFNVATAHRQPGSTFKPIVYATAFEQGFTPETVVFDVPTQFSVNCEPTNFSSTDGCYSPVNYDGVFRGPMTFRDALAQSINIPAVKALYLAGIGNALTNARELGISTLTKAPRDYGLPLALGGGEVSLLELTNAYAALANDGVRHEHTGIIRVEDAASGEVLEEYDEEDVGDQVIASRAARLTTSVLTDIQAREPAYGRNSFSFGRQAVGVKTGTTNDYRDVWIMGYTPRIAVGTWGGNNDNSPIVKRVAGFVLAPMWRAFMDEALTIVPYSEFSALEVDEEETALKPVLRGFWQGAATTTPTTQPSVHSILHWVDRSNPRGPVPSDPSRDPQYVNWETAVRIWAQENAPQLVGSGTFPTPQFPQNGTTPTTTQGEPFSLTYPAQNMQHRAGTPLTATVGARADIELVSVEYYLNGAYMGSATGAPFSISLVPQYTGTGAHTLTAVGYTKNAETFTQQVTFHVTQ